MRIIKKILKFFFTKYALKNIGSYTQIPNVNFYSRFTKNAHFGKNTNFNGFTIRGKGKVSIGDNFHSGKQCLIINSYHKYDFGDAIPYDTNETIDKNVIIEDNVWFGDRVLILGGVTIGEGAIIQAGAVVTSNIPKCAIAGGNPAKVFKYRDIENYERLKKEGNVC
jgi:acetyltransferase-like isoleucine patch superfamily enzyme